MQFFTPDLYVEQKGGNPCFTHSILFSNGWEVRLRFRDVQVSTAHPVYPLPQQV